MLIGELVPETLRYLRDNPACPERTMYSYIFVDEYQDLNKAEQKLIDLLSEKKIDDGIVNAGKVLVLCPRRQFGYRIRDKLRAIGINAHSFFHEEALEGNPIKSEKAEAQEAFTLLTLLANQNDSVALRCWLGF